MTVHKAQPVHGEEFNRVQGTIIDDCAVCSTTVKRVPGGMGPVWIHESTGAVAGTDPEPTIPDQDWTDPEFVLGAVLVQLEDLDHITRLRVLREALEIVEDES